MELYVTLMILEGSGFGVAASFRVLAASEDGSGGLFEPLVDGELTDKPPALPYKPQKHTHRHQR